MWDRRCKDMQELRPHEAELLHGMTKNCTAGEGITNGDRLQAIGASWDFNATRMIWRFCTDAHVWFDDIAI